MIGEEDLADLLDPDEFGAELTLREAGKPDQVVRCLPTSPQAAGRLYRSGMDPNAAALRVRPSQRLVQLANGDVPVGWKLAKALLEGVEYSITSVDPVGRLRSALVLVPYGDRSAPAGDRGKWLASSSG